MTEMWTGCVNPAVRDILAYQIIWYNTSILYISLNTKYSRLLVVDV